MKEVNDKEKRVAECVGLWLAEGWNKSKSEITFTNTCLELIDLFKDTINEIFRGHDYNQRIYIYSKTGKKISLPYPNCVIKYYVHKRATKPFLIFRIASVELIKEWRKKVTETLNKTKLFPYVLRGFFAGEGNIKEGSHNSRVLRIAQIKQKKFIDRILEGLEIEFSFKIKNRSYEIHGKPMWDIFARLGLADLHPDKKKKFWEVYSHFKEEHYKINFLIKKILPLLKNPYSTKQLSEIFKRTPARIQEILTTLKKQNKINNFRVKNIDYWTNNLNLVIISKLKNKYLLFLGGLKQTSEFAKEFKVCWKSSFNRLKELEKLNLIRRQKDGRWIKLATKKKILVI